MAATRFDDSPRDLGMVDLGVGFVIAGLPSTISTSTDGVAVLSKTPCDDLAEGVLLTLVDELSHVLIGRLLAMASSMGCGDPSSTRGRVSLLSFHCLLFWASTLGGGSGCRWPDSADRRCGQGMCL